MDLSSPLIPALGLLFQVGEARRRLLLPQVALMAAKLMILAVQVLAARMVSATSRTSRMEQHALMMVTRARSISAKPEAVLIRAER